MRYPIVFITILGCFAATGLVYSQSVSSVSSKQLAKVWEQSGKKGDKDGMIEGNAVLIFDGDTIGIVAKDGSRYTIRLRGIDAPENRQPFGLESTNQLAYMVQGMDVVVIVGERDSNNKYIGAVFMDSEDVSLAQIRKGMAWCYNTPGITMSKVQKDAFKSAEEKAKADRLGLWVSGDPIAPWIFRGEKGDEPEVVKNTPVNSTANTHTPNPDAPPVSVLPAVVKPPTTEQTRKYILGPRGGCYYLNEQGAKTYVRNKELCNKP